MMSLLFQSPIKSHINQMDAYLTLIKSEIDAFNSSDQKYWAPELFKQLEMLKMNQTYNEERLAILKKMSKGAVITQDEHHLLLKMQVLADEPDIANYSNVCVSKAVQTLKP